MSKRKKKITLVATADWNEANNRDGFRFLNLEIEPFLQRNKLGGWRLEPGDKIEFLVQIIDRKPQETSVSITGMEPKRLSTNFCPALRLQNHGEDPKITPFKKPIDYRLRQGLTNFQEIVHPLFELDASSLFEVLDHNGKLFRAKFRKKGNFEFMIGLAIDAHDTQGHTVERRRFRTDPEMDVGCSTGGVCQDPGKKCKKKYRY